MSECQDRGLRSTQEALYHINYLELLAAFLALKSFVGKKMGLVVVLKMVAMLPSTGGVELVPREKHMGKSRSVPSRYTCLPPVRPDTFLTISAGVWIQK